MIDLTLQPDRRKRAIQRARERNIIIPTYNEIDNIREIIPRILAAPSTA